MTRITIGLSLILFAAFTATGQLAADTTAYESAYAKAVDKYFQSLSDQAPYFSGPLYPRYPFHFSEGRPYFPNNVPVIGGLVLDGIQYNNVRLMYDEVADELVAENISRTSLILLPKHKIAAFNIGEHKFIQMGGDSGKTSLNRGFYQLLYDGKTKAIKKTIKSIQARANPATAFDRVIESRTFYYIFINGYYYRFTNRRSLLAGFRENKKAIRDHLKERQLEFKNKPEETIAVAAAYYDQLTK